MAYIYKNYENFWNVFMETGTKERAIIIMWDDKHLITSAIFSPGKGIRVELKKTGEEKAFYSIGWILFANHMLPPVTEGCEWEKDLIDFMKGLAKMFPDTGHMMYFSPSCSEDILHYIQSGRDLYNPLIQTYFFVYNAENAIATYKVSSNIAYDLAKQSEETGEYWGAFFGPGGQVYDEAEALELFGNILKSTPTAWYDTEDYTLESAGSIK